MNESLKIELCESEIYAIKELLQGKNTCTTPLLEKLQVSNNYELAGILLQNGYITTKDISEKFRKIYIYGKQRKLMNYPKIELINSYG